MICLKVVNLLIEGMVPELLADEDHGIELVLESRCIPGSPLHQAAPYTTPKCLQTLRNITLEHV